MAREAKRFASRLPTRHLFDRTIMCDEVLPALPGGAYDLLNALAAVNKRGVTLTVAPVATPTGLPGAFLPALPIAIFEPTADWSMALKLRQLLQEMEGVKLTAWREHLQAQKRAVATALDQALRDAAANQTREVEDERQKLQHKLRGLDKLTRDLGTLEQKLQAVMTPVRQNRSKAELAFSQALRG